jgi:hypothetical protein
MRAVRMHAYKQPLILEDVPIPDVAPKASAPTPDSDLLTFGSQPQVSICPHLLVPFPLCSPMLWLIPTEVPTLQGIPALLRSFPIQIRMGVSRD